MKSVKVTMYMDIDDDFLDEAKIWERHIENLINTDDYPEIDWIYSVQVEEVDYEGDDDFADDLDSER